MRVHQNQARYYRQPSLFTSALVRFAWLLALATLVLSPRVLMAQEAPPAQAEAAEKTEQEEFFGEDHRRKIYEQSALSTTTATLYNLALPGLGNIYAEQYFYAGIAFTLMVFTLVFESYGLVTNQPDFLWIGGGTALIAYTGSIATSIYGVHDYNEKLRQGLKLEEVSQAGPFDVPRAPTVSVGFRF